MCKQYGCEESDVYINAVNTRFGAGASSSSGSSEFVDAIFKLIWQLIVFTFSGIVSIFKWLSKEDNRKKLSESSKSFLRSLKKLPSRMASQTYFRSRFVSYFSNKSKSKK